MYSRQATESLCVVTALNNLAVEMVGSYAAVALMDLKLATGFG
jgi:hypothetical protein